MRECPFCRSEWQPRIANPVQCPRCKRVLPEAIGRADAVKGSSGSGKVGRGKRGERNAAVPVLPQE